MHVSTSLVAGIAAFAAGIAPLFAAPQQPNVLLIVADDLGYGDLGCYGAELIETPNIDRLAAEGLRFTDAHAPSAVCQPSRYGILAGRYNWRRDKAWDGTYVFAPQEPTLQRVLRDAGYNTGIIGKWHLGLGNGPVDYNNPEIKPGPHESGFNYFFGTPRTHNEPPYVFMEGRSVVGLDPADPIEILSSAEAKKRGLPDYGWGASVGARKAHALRPVDQIDQRFTEKALEWIGRQKVDTTQPFFLYLPYVAPHVPNEPTAEFKETSKARAYGDVIQELDAHVGQVLDRLEQLGFADNTLVILTSDNGGVYLDDAVRTGHRPNAKLLGQKTDAWEGGNRVPLIVRWPGEVPAGETTGALVSLTDIMATVLAAAAVPTPEGAAPDSIDQLPVWRDPGTSTPARTEMVYKGIFGFGLRQNEWVYYPFAGSGGMTAHPTQKWGQPYQRIGFVNSDHEADGRLKNNAPKQQLYDVSTDPGQRENVIGSRPELAASMAARLKEIVGEQRLKQ